MKELLSDSAKRTLLGPGRRCTANNRDGERCRRVPILGGFVCTMHGGKAPLTIHAANQRKLLMVEPALDVIARAMDSDDLALAKDTAFKLLDRTGHGPQASLLLARAPDPSPWTRWLTNEQLAQIAQWVEEAKARMLEGEEPAPMTGLPVLAQQNTRDAVLIDDADSQERPDEGPVPTGNEPPEGEVTHEPEDRG